MTPEQAEAINAARRRGGRIVCVGTTSVRTLETVAAASEKVDTATDSTTSTVDAMVSDYNGKAANQPEAKEMAPQLPDAKTVGEQAGDMASSLEHIGKRYQKDMDNNIAAFTNALEPILIVAIAGVVGFIAISILMAVFEVSSTLG